MDAPTLAGVLLVGSVVGFLGGAFGKGGSAVATPLLVALGLPPFVALASPLPATVPATLLASRVYARERLLDRRLVTRSIAVGVPAVVAGAWASSLVDARSLVEATEVLLVAFGVRTAVAARRPAPETPAVPADPLVAAAIALVVGLASGLLANAGGFLLAPLYLVLLHLPVKRAFALSLAVATVLAIPGTIVHAALGHIDWSVVVVFAASAIPNAYLGARVAIRSKAVALERAYGLALVVLGITLLATSL